MPFSNCLYHVIWATRGRTPSLSAPVEALVLDTIRNKSAEMDCPVHAINACEDHIHVAVSIRPAVSVSEWVSKVKGISSRSVNTEYPALDFAWQGGYGVLTFGQSQMEFVQGYIERQKEHHQQHTTYSGLERADE